MNVNVNKSNFNVLNVNANELNFQVNVLNTDNDLGTHEKERTSLAKMN